MCEYVPHTPRRGFVPIEKTAAAHHTVEIAERTAFVTYHNAPVRMWQGRCYLDLSTCLATWEEGDGTDDDPPRGGGGQPMPSGSPTPRPTGGAPARELEAA